MKSAWRCYKGAVSLICKLIYIILVFVPKWQWRHFSGLIPPSLSLVLYYKARFGVNNRMKNDFLRFRLRGKSIKRMLSVICYWKNISLGVFFVTRSDGNVDVWDLLDKYVVVFFCLLNFVCLLVVKWRGYLFYVNKILCSSPDLMSLL